MRPDAIAFADLKVKERDKKLAPCARQQNSASQSFSGVALFELDEEVEFFRAGGELQGQPHEVGISFLVDTVE
jgi:hypothetical protein